MNPDVLLSGLIGVVLGFVLNTMKDEIRDTRLRERERGGLLRILFAEVSLNQRVVQTLLSPYDAANPKLAKKIVARVASESQWRVHTDAWQAVRVKLAHSLSSEEFATLRIYYQNLLWAEAAILGNKETEKKVDTVGIDLEHPTLSVLHKKVQEVEDTI